MIKKIIRINVTNQCNMSCITCPISANSSKIGFIKFSDFQNILCEQRNIPLDVVLEGGEPFLHPRWNLFLEYADTNSDVKKVIISTNGTLIKENYNTLLDTINRLHLYVQLNVAITKHLIETNEGHLEMCKSLLSEDKFHTTFDVTYTSEEEKNELMSLIREYRIPMERCSFSIVRAYGALKNTEYPKLEQQSKIMSCYATDGTYFGCDLSKRADYELSLCYGDIPIFDIVNHRQLWLLTHGFLADLTFENQDNCKQSVKDFQLEYFRCNTPESVYGSYIREFKRLYGDNKDPFCVLYAEKLEDEVVEGLAYLMETTISMKRFYEFKDLALKLCREIAYLKVRDDIRTTDEDCCK